MTTDYRAALPNFGAAVGAPVTRKSADAIGADGYVENALQAVKELSLFVGEQVLEPIPEAASPLASSTLAVLLWAILQATLAGSYLSHCQCSTIRSRYAAPR
ncbi:MAG: hypothetical protein CFH05_00393 [Alphaproteobacteria bacterium MarineAlpha3_Bin4]|nr:MAG: hypothetical protein CFH05_00393 [Alphaproteobacteria bacterium MarineAlpha3_Bin4]